MAEHKVPQNVEAEDKLLGPFSFRQFLYLLVALGAGALAYFLGTVAIPLAFIPAPIAVLFIVLALPLRKDQPMETYLGAMIHFYFSPNRRIWDSDGQDLLVEITNPRTDDGPQTKDIGGAEAAQRLSFLTEVTDTRGWSTRGVLGMPNNTNLTDDLASAAMEVPDMLDDDTMVGRDIEGRLAKTTEQRRAEIMNKLKTASAPSSAPQQIAPATPQSFVHADQAVNNLSQQSDIDSNQDEKALAAALRQSSQLAQPVYQQTVISPIAPAAPMPQEQVQPPVANQPLEANPQPIDTSRSVLQNIGSTTVPAETNATESVKIENVSNIKVPNVSNNQLASPVLSPEIIEEDRGAIFDEGETEVILH